MSQSLKILYHFPQITNVPTFETLFLDMETVQSGMFHTFFVFFLPAVVN